MNRTLFLRIFTGYAAVIVLLAAAVTLVAPPLMRTHHVEERAAELENLGFLLESRILPYVTGRPAGDLERLVTDIGHRTGTRITVIAADGSVLADSEREPRDMENHLFRPEIQASLRGEKLMSIRPSSTLKADMMYMSRPLLADGRVVGALRLSLFMKDIEVLLGALRADLFRVAGLTTLIALALALLLTRSVAGPVREVIDAFNRLAAGDFEVSVSTRRSGEFRDFARGFNGMTGRLKSLFAENRLRNEEIRAILASVKEGLCVIEGDSRIVLCNASFRRMTGSEACQGRYFWEVVRSSSAAEAVRKARESGRETAGEATIGDRPCVLTVAPLTESGRLVVTVREAG